MKVDHYALVVAQMQPALTLFTQALNGTVTSQSRDESRCLEIAFVNVGGSSFEIIAPWAPGTAFWEFLQSTGGGFHHVAFVAEDLDGTLKHLGEMGVHPQGAPTGTADRVIQWLKPEDTLNAVMQLIHYKR